MPKTWRMQAAWDEVILGKVLPCVSDSTEKCRELAIRLIRAVAQSLPEVNTQSTNSMVLEYEKNFNAKSLGIKIHDYAECCIIVAVEYCTLYGHFQIESRFLL